VSMMVFRRSIPRRTVLRGAGAALALPLLDAMLPAFATGAQTASRRATRLSFFTVPNGIIMDKWTPAAVGRNYPITPVLEPLAAFKDRMVVLSGLANN
jgi:hypothetical protein